MNTAKLKGIWLDYKFWIIGIIAITIILLFAGEYLYDKTGEIIYNRAYKQRMAELDRLKDAEKALELENAELKAKNAELSKIQTEKDSARSEKDKQDAENASKELEEKFKEIANTPKSEQIKMLCEEDAKLESPRKWSFCQ